MWLRLLGSTLCRQWLGNVIDWKSLGLAVSVKLSTSNIWVTRCRQLALWKNSSIRFISVTEMCPAEGGRA